MHVAPGGDAILVVDNSFGEGQVKLKVDTRILRKSSKVFNAMFGPYFLEGQQLDQGIPPEIRLQDDSVSIIIICQVTHGQIKRYRIASAGLKYFDWLRLLISMSLRKL